MAATTPAEQEYFFGGSLYAEYTGIDSPECGPGEDKLTSLGFTNNIAQDGYGAGFRLYGAPQADGTLDQPITAKMAFPKGFLHPHQLLSSGHRQELGAWSEPTRHIETVTNQMGETMEYEVVTLTYQGPLTQPVGDIPASEPWLDSIFDIRLAMNTDMTHCVSDNGFTVPMGYSTSDSLFGAPGSYTVDGITYPLPEDQWQDVIRIS